MPSVSLRARSFEALSNRYYYGWTILAVAGLAAFCTGPGQSHTFSVFVGPIGTDLGLSKSAIASAYGGATLAAAFCLPFLGRRVDAFGGRRVMLAVTGLLGLACIAFAATPGLIWLAVGFAALRFLGQGSLMLTGANIVSHWFDRNRGFALGLMTIGFGASMAIHPPVAQYLIGTFGWRWAWVAMGLATWILLLPPVLILVYDRPEDRGLRPDGAPAEPHATDRPGKTGAEIGLSLSEALSTPAFYIIAAGLFAISMLVTTLHFYQITLLTAGGLSAQTAARIFPVSAITMVLAMPLIGRLFDRLPTRFMFMSGLLLTATSLLAVTLVSTLPTALAYALVFGLTNAVMMTQFAFMWPRYFGRLHLGAIQGTGQMIAVVGASLGPLPVGLAIDLTGDPIPTIRLLALFPVLCAGLAIFLATPRVLVDAGFPE